jgi:Acetyltransferase (GNAT) domain
MVAAVEEMFLIPTYASQRPFAPVITHRALALPLQLGGPVLQWDSSLAGGPRVVGIGRRKLLEPFCRKLLGGLVPVGQRPSTGLLSPAKLAEWDADLIIAGIHRWMVGRFERAGWTIVPSSVRWTGSLATVPPSQICRSLMSNLNKVRAYGFTLTQSNSPDAWAEFFRRMVEPQARSRHGEGAWLPSERFTRKLQQIGTLHLIMRDGERVAGTCSVARGDTLWLPLMGVRDGDPTLLRQGAGVATLALPFQWAKAQHFRWVDAGRTSPFVTDGIQRYKRTWGLTPVPDPLAQIIAIYPRSARARQAFKNSPALVERGSRLEIFSGE